MHLASILPLCLLLALTINTAKGDDCLSSVYACAEASKKMSHNKDCSESNAKAFSECYNKLNEDSQCKSYYARFIADIKGVFATECKHLSTTSSGSTKRTSSTNDISTKCLPWVIPCAEASKKMSRKKDCSDSNVNTFSDCHEKLYDDSQCKSYYGRFITDIGKVFAKECKHLFTTGGSTEEKREIIDTSVFTSDECQKLVKDCEDVFYKIGTLKDCSKETLFKMDRCYHNLKTLLKCFNYYSYIVNLVSGAFTEYCREAECKDAIDICNKTDNALKVNKDCSISNSIENCEKSLQTVPQCLNRLTFFITNLKDSYDSICKPYDCQTTYNACTGVLKKLNDDQDCSKENLFKAYQCRANIAKFAHCYKSYSYMIDNMETAIGNICLSSSC